MLETEGAREAEGGVEAHLTGYLVEALKIIRSWMNYYFSTLGLFILVILVAAFQLERDCGAISDRTLLQLPPQLSDDCKSRLATKAGDKTRAEVPDDKPEIKPEITMFGVVIIRDYFSLVFGVIFFSFVAILWLRFRSLVSILDRLDDLETARIPEKRLSDIVGGFPWSGSPFHADRVGPSIFWGGLGLGLAILGLTALTHVFANTGDLVIGKEVYRGIGWVNLTLFAGFVWFLHGARAKILKVRARLATAQEPDEQSGLTGA